MKYLEVKEISVARDDRYVANAYPQEGLWITQYDRDPVCVLAGRVWRLPVGSHALVVDSEAGKQSEAKHAVGGQKYYLPRLSEGQPEPRPAKIKTDDSDRWAPRNPAADPLALRRWAMETACRWSGRIGMPRDEREAMAEEILRWVLQVG